MAFIKYLFFETLLHSACKSGNTDLVKYLNSLDECIEIKSETILILFYAILF